MGKPTIDHGDQKKFSVLIVDDCSSVQVLHRVWALKLGLEVQIAENGKIAVDLHRSGASFDLILMDLAMPVMNGEQVLIYALNTCICEGFNSIPYDRVR